MTSALPIGELRHRLTIERSSQDADGETVWTPVDTVFAAIVPTSSGETTAGAAATGTASHRIEMRWRGDISSRDRLRDGDRIFRIVATRDLDERHRRLVVFAEEDGR
jgi:SPP1 family predicted phage head-tail adaptor